MNAMRTAILLIVFTATLFFTRVGHPADRRVPEIPASGEKLRVIIDTDAACEIADRVIVFWHGRTRWPDKAWNFNVYNDLKAARILFRSRLPLVLFDTGTYLRCPMDKSERAIRPYGRLGQFLHDVRLKNKWYQSPTKGFYDLGDVAALVDPSLVYWEVVDAPAVNWDMMYDHQKTNGKMARIYQIDSDRTFALLHKRLAGAFPQR